MEPVRSPDKSESYGIFLDNQVSEEYSDRITTKEVMLLNMRLRCVKLKIIK